MAQQVSLPDGTIIPDFPDNPTPQDIAKLRQVGMEMEAAMARNPYEGGGPVDKLPFSDERVETLPELGRIAAKTAYDATLGVPVGIQRALDAGFEGTVGMVAPETAAGMKRAREFSYSTDPVAQAANAAERFIQPRSSEGTRIANVASMAAGGGLMGKIGTAFSPAMGLGSGMASGLASEGYGAASNPKKWQGDPAGDEQLGKLAMGLGVGVASPYVSRGTQLAVGTKPAQERLTRLFKRGGIEPEMVEQIMQPGGILERANRVGIPLTTAQALPIDNALDAAQGTARGNIEMALTRRKLAEQPQQSLNAVTDWVNQSVVGQGRRLPTQTLANQGRASANAHFDSIGADAVAAKELAMPRSGSSGAQVPSTVAKDFLAQAKAYAKSRPNTRAQDVVKAVKTALINPKWAAHEKTLQGVPAELPNPAVAAYANDPKMLAIAEKIGIPTTIPNPKFQPNPHPKFLADENQVRGALDSALAGFGRNIVDTPAVSAELNKHAGHLRGLIEDVIAPTTPGVNAGKAAAEQVLRRADADKQKLVGGMRGEPDMPAPLSSSPSEIFKDTKRAPAAGQVGEITELRRQLERGTDYGLDAAQAAGRPAPDLNPTLFPDAARTHFADVLDKAGARGGARPSDSTAQVLLEELGNFSRTKNKRADMTQEIVQNVGDSLQRPAAQTALDKKGLGDIMDVVGHTVERQGSGGINASEVLANMSSPWMRKLAGTSWLAPAKTPIRALTSRQEAASSKWLDSLLNTDEGRKQFAAMLRAPEGSIHRAALSNILQELSGKPGDFEAAEQFNRRKGQ